MYIHALYTNRLEAMKADGHLRSLFMHGLFGIQAMADHMRSPSVLRLVLPAMVAALKWKHREDIIKTYVADGKSR
jgi:hypothetical protein